MNYLVVVALSAFIFGLMVGELVEYQSRIRYISKQEKNESR